MTIKDFNSVVKDEGVKASADLKIKVSVQAADGTWHNEILPIEAYYVTKAGELQLGCCLWHPDADND